MNTNNNDNTRHSTTDHDLSRQDDTGRDNQTTVPGTLGEVNYTHRNTHPKNTDDTSIHDKSRPVATERDLTRQGATERDMARQVATTPLPSVMEYAGDQVEGNQMPNTSDQYIRERRPDHTGNSEQKPVDSYPNKEVSIESHSPKDNLSETSFSERSSWIEISRAIEELKQQGIVRTVRTVQRYCSRGKLTCRLVPTENSVRYLVEQSSIDEFVTQHNQTMPSHGFGTSPDHKEQGSRLSTEQQTDMEKAQIAQSNQQTEVILSLKDQQIDMLKSQLNVTNKQLEMKDEQISAMLERDHETNVLIQNLQNLMALPSAGQTSAGSTSSQANSVG